ncbi:MAG: MGH1-like glycoside hydrolase domain-containing protein [Solirubrobacteraceae bacterium]
MRPVESASGESELRELCRTTLERNWREGVREGVPYAYTAPSSGRYPWQWYWDSCFTAIVWRRFDPRRARAELESLLAAATPDGFIGHTIFWAEPVSRVRSLFYNVCSRSDFMTATIQPPLLAWAWRIAVGDPAEVPAIVRHHDWVEQHRALDDDGLLWIIQPDESGLDASPKFDSTFGWCADGLPGFPLLVRRNRHLGFDVARIDAAGGPLVCGTVTNVFHGLSRLALARPSITPAIVDRLYDERRGIFHQLVRRHGQRWTMPRRVVTWAALSPLALPDLPEEIGRRLVEQYLLDPNRFWLPVPPPSVSAADPGFSRSDRFLLLRRYWRGPTWINAAWLLWLGLVRLGYRSEAAELGARIARAVRAAGLREYYDPYTGEGMGATDFSWSALVMELIDPDAQAASSHLGAAAQSSSSTNAVVNEAASTTVSTQRFSGLSEGQW